MTFWSHGQHLYGHYRAHTRLWSREAVIYVFMLSYNVGFILMDGPRLLRLLFKPHQPRGVTLSTCDLIGEGSTLPYPPPQSIIFTIPKKRHALTISTIHMEKLFYWTQERVFGLKISWFKWLSWYDRLARLARHYQNSRPGRNTRSSHGNDWWTGGRKRNGWCRGTKKSLLMIFLLLLECICLPQCPFYFFFFFS